MSDLRIQFKWDDLRFGLVINTKQRRTVPLPVAVRRRQLALPLSG